jgi:hypothetical protein
MFVNGEVGRAREKGDRDRAMVPAVSDASYPGHLVNQSIQSRADFAGKRKALGANASISHI